MTTSPSETTIEEVKPKRVRKPRKVFVTSAEANLANKLGLTVEDFAKEKLKSTLKRGRPAGKRKPFKRTPKEQALFDQLLNDNMTFITQNNNHIKEILELKHQITGFRAVISYLEHRLGWGSSQ